MYKKIVSKTLLALAVSGAMSYAIATPGASENNAVVSHDATLKLFEAWVGDLQKAFPTMHTFTLEDYKAEGNRATGTVRTQIKTLGGNRYYGDAMALGSDTKVVVENGFALSKHGLGAAKIQWTTALSEDTDEEIAEFFGKDPFLKADGIVTLAGDIHVDLQNPAPFKKEVERDVMISIPSYTGTFHSYNARATGDMTMSIPSMEVSDAQVKSAETASGAWFTNFQFKLTDRPIKTGYWEFVGSSSGGVEKIDIRNKGTSVFTLSNMTFSETGQMDDKKLYSDAFTIKSEGSFNHPDTKQPIKIDTFQMDGTIKNMQVDAYLALTENLYSDRPDTKKLELQALELMKHEPQLNFDKITLSFNGKEGTASMKMSIAPMTEDEKKSMPLYLAFLQKFKFEASMDIPDAWISMLFPKEADQMNATLTMGEQEGYLVRKDGRIKTNCKYEMGNLTVNGKPIKGMGGMPF